MYRDTEILQETAEFFFLKKWKAMLFYGTGRNIISKIFMMILVFLSYLGDSTCFRFILQSSEQQSGNSDELDSELKSVVHQMTSIISHKRSNSSALSAVIEVTVETIVVNSAEKSGKHIGI